MQTPTNAVSECSGAPPCIVAAVAVLALLAGCAGSSSGPSTTQARQAGSGFCSLRAVVNLRQGVLTRNDAELVTVARRMNIDLDVLQSMGRTSRMVIVRANGPPAACEGALDELGRDLRIESVQRF